MTTTPPPTETERPPCAGDSYDSMLLYAPRYCVDCPLDTGK